MNRDPGYKSSTFQDCVYLVGVVSVALVLRVTRSTGPLLFPSPPGPSASLCPQAGEPSFQGVHEADPGRLFENLRYRSPKSPTSLDLGGEECIQTYPGGGGSPGGPLGVITALCPLWCCLFYSLNRLSSQRRPTNILYCSIELSLRPGSSRGRLWTDIGAHDIIITETRCHQSEGPWQEP